MTNPSDAIGTNGAFGGRTSVNAFNDALATYNDRGILSGWTCLPNSGMTVALGGITGRRDVAVAMDSNGNFTSINNISGAPVNVTLPAAPGTNKRIDVVVAYVDNPPQGDPDETDNYGACGIIPVSGTVAANPSMPNESTIRSAITADGASGSTAYYVILAKVTVASGTTDIDSTMIEAGQHAEIQGAVVGTGAIQDGSVTAGKIDLATLYVGSPITSNVNIGAGSTATLGSITLPAGKWLIMWNVRWYAASASTVAMMTRLTSNGSDVQSINNNAAAGGDYARGVQGSQYEATVTGTQTFSLVAGAPVATTVSGDTSYLRAIRVG